MRSTEVYISPPGATLRNLLDEREISQGKLAANTGLDAETITGIIAGVTPITSATALTLEKALGAPATFWMQREANYQVELRKRNKE